MNEDLKQDVKELLESFGFKLIKKGNYYTTNAFWRGGNDETSVAIYPNTNLIVDFVTGDKFRIDTLLKNITKTDDDGLKKLIQEKDFNLSFLESEIYRPQIKLPKIFNAKELNCIIDDQSYVIDRGIDINIAKKLKGGVVKDGKMKDRYVWPIFNSVGNLIGFNGRTLVNSRNKYKHLGSDKKNWCWPCFFNIKDIQSSNYVILVESAMDVLSLMTCGINSVICLFGSDINLGVLNLLIKLNNKKIIISNNNDDEKNKFAGQRAAEKNYNKLTRYFSEKNIITLFPQKGKDWNEILVNHGKQEVIDQINRIYAKS